MHRNFRVATIAGVTALMAALGCKQPDGQHPAPAP